MVGIFDFTTFIDTRLQTILSHLLVAKPCSVACTFIWNPAEPTEIRTEGVKWMFSPKPNSPRRWRSPYPWRDPFHHFAQLNLNPSTLLKRQFENQSWYHIWALSFASCVLARTSVKNIEDKDLRLVPTGLKSHFNSTGHLPEKTVEPANCVMLGCPCSPNRNIRWYWHRYSVVSTRSHDWSQHTSRRWRHRRFIPKP